MQNKFGIFPWSDNWWIEENEAWFVLGARNILCCFDLKENRYKLIVNIPDSSKPKFRLTSYCMKYNNDIYCMPVCGKNVWVYSIEYDSFYKIHIEDAPEEGLDIYDFWEYESRMFAVSIKLKRIIEIDMEKRKIANYYELCKEDSITRSIKVGMAIYSLSGTSERMYSFDLNTKEVIVYQLPNVGTRFNTITFDGKDFWMGGYRQEIYLWNKEKNILDVYSDFPLGFGVYSFQEENNNKVDYLADGFEMPPFLHSIAVGEYVWFIPFQTNKIVYVDKKYHKLYAFEIAEEIESKESLLERTELKTKFLLEYVRCNRYIGLYSTKNNSILEIDTAQLTYKWYENSFDDGCLYSYAMLIDNVFYEEDEWDRHLYQRILQLSDWQTGDIEQYNAGIEIYKRTIND